MPIGVRLQVFPNLLEEVRGVLTQVKILLTQGVKAKDIILVTRDEKLYGETLIDLAWEYSIPVRVCYEIPLEQSRIGAWLKLLLEVIGGNFFKWFSARLLKLKELTEAELDLGAAVRGNLYHRCLELSLEHIKTADDLAKFNQEQLVKAFTKAEAELNLTQLPGWSVQRQEHLNLLALNLTTAEFLPAQSEVIARETKFSTQWYGLNIKGRVDRIDRTITGLTIIDYKTSGVIPAGVKDAMGKANLDIQLAVYQDAIAKKYPGEAIDGAAYYSVNKQKTISRHQKDAESLAIFAEQVKAHLEQGHYPVAPDVDRKACRYCDYDLVCRQRSRQSYRSE